MFSEFLDNAFNLPILNGTLAKAILIWSRNISILYWCKVKLKKSSYPSTNMGIKVPKPYRQVYSPSEPLCWVVASELFVFTVFIVW